MTYEGQVSLGFLNEMDCNSTCQNHMLRFLLNWSEVGTGSKILGLEWGFGVCVFRFRVLGVFRFQHSRLEFGFLAFQVFEIQGLRQEVQVGLGVGVWGLGFYGLRFSGLRLRVLVIRFRVLKSLDLRLEVYVS